MQAFAALLENLLYSPKRSVKEAHLLAYVRATPDPARGYAMAALCGELSFPAMKSAALRALIKDRVDSVLFDLSYDYVGDLAETVALLWPTRRDAPLPTLPAVIDALQQPNPPLTAWLDSMDATERWALLKLITGGMRVGVSAGLVKAALAAYGGQRVADIEQLWPALTPPYTDLFAWLEGRAPMPDVSAKPIFRPMMLAHPMEARESITLTDYQVEWKWDGIRVQVLGMGAEKRLFSRTGDDISAAFPDIVEAITVDGCFDGELLVRDAAGAVAPFNALQQRLNRKTVSKVLLKQYPAFICLYDVLGVQGQDVRGQPLAQRRALLEEHSASLPPDRFTLSDILPITTGQELDALMTEARAQQREGLMLKRKDSAYLAGRPKGYWWKLKRDPLTIDAVLLYAQRGHGKRSSLYSDYTFGVWQGDTLVPVGKAYSGFTDVELKQLDKWIRTHTVNRYGPVREVAQGMVLEIAFDSVHRSARHKSGVAMRFPRVHRVRWDKPAAEAERLHTLENMVE
jgi:DNA ligase-1